MHNLSHELFIIYLYIYIFINYLYICTNSSELARFIANYFAILHNISKNLNLIRNSNQKMWSFEYMLAIGYYYYYNIMATSKSFVSQGTINH